MNSIPPGVFFLEAYIILPSNVALKRARILKEVLRKELLSSFFPSPQHRSQYTQRAALHVVLFSLSIYIPLLELTQLLRISPREFLSAKKKENGVIM